MTTITPRDLDDMLKGNPELIVMKDHRALQGSIAGMSMPSRRATKQDDPWTETEKAFARQWLQPRLEGGEYLWYMAQVTVYMPGQTYTFDFVAARPEGGCDYFEVKGKVKLGSQDRSSVKVRWATTHLRPSPNSPHRVFWARQNNKDGWVVREIKPTRGVHPAARKV